MDIQKFELLIRTSYQRLKELEEEHVSQRPQQGKWSRKEILGHLCDSAINNYYRFLHLQKEGQPFVVSTYNQRHWVSSADYQRRPWSEILSLWISLNQSLLLVIHNSITTFADTPVQIGDRKKTYSFLVDDYYDHLSHHMNQILSD